jgi:hypothetical protein
VPDAPTVQVGVETRFIAFVYKSFTGGSVSLMQISNPAVTAGIGAVFVEKTLI